MRPASRILLVLFVLIAALGWIASRESELGQPASIAPTGPRTLETPQPSSEARVAVEVGSEADVSDELSAEPKVRAVGARIVRVNVVDATTGAPVVGACVHAEWRSPRVESMHVLRLDEEGRPTSPGEGVEAEDAAQGCDGDLTDASGGVNVEVKDDRTWFRAHEGVRAGMARVPELLENATIQLRALAELEIEVVDRFGRPAVGALVVELEHSRLWPKDRTGRLKVPVIATGPSDEAEKLDFLLPLADSRPARHMVGTGELPTGVLRFVLDDCGTLELVASSDGVRIEGFELDFRVRLTSREGEESSRTLDLEQSTLSGSILIPHVSPGRRIACNVFHERPSCVLVFPRLEIDGTEPGRAFTAREIPLQRGLVRFRGVAVDESGSPLASALIWGETDSVMNGRLLQDDPVVYGVSVGPEGEFDTLESWDDHGRLPDWEPGRTFEFRARSQGARYVATMRAPHWTLHPSVSRLRWLDFGTIVFRRTDPVPLVR
ncbi:MAG: hypothetical protein NTV21_18475 [Planctomycetota bacterium]|nr:hypothetical protein [Planctomycetota bacterium]